MDNEELIENEAPQNQEEKNTEDTPFDVQQPRHYMCVYIDRLLADKDHEEEIVIECGIRDDGNDTITPVARLNDDNKADFEEIDEWNYTSTKNVVMIGEYSWVSDLERAYPEFSGYRRNFNDAACDIKFPLSFEEELNIRRVITEEPTLRGIDLRFLKKLADWAAKHHSENKNSEQED
ncbi:hypothetical protein [uncultured Limosilactobacillus sp.]|uniref:hypothetical protein n=1 Tax=uncultured Limosilactobacillus sp. TaxID=2837629 RepID=UPI0025DF9CB0|nr:hypothetical protein [uncultured Limosilactobacillus sp.]